MKINGVVTAIPGGGLAGYTFHWYQNDGTTLIAQGSSPTHALFNEGDYKVRIENDASECFSNLESFTIGEAHDFPVIIGNFTKIDSKSCDQINNPTGSITLDPDGAGAPVNYTYKWYNGPITGIPTGLEKLRLT